MINTTTKMSYHKCFCPTLFHFGKLLQKEKIYFNICPLRNQVVQSSCPCSNQKSSCPCPNQKQEFPWQPCFLSNQDQISKLCKGPYLPQLLPVMFGPIKYQSIKIPDHDRARWLWRKRPRSQIKNHHCLFHILSLVICVFCFDLTVWIISLLSNHAYNIYSYYEKQNFWTICFLASTV